MGISQIARPVPGGGTAQTRHGGRAWLVDLLLVALAVAGVAVLLTWRSPGAAAPALVRVPDAPTDVVAHGGELWVASQRAGTVLRLDPSTGAPRGRPVRTGGNPAQLALGGVALWVADASRGVVVAVRTDTGRVARRFALGADVTDVSLAAGALWATSSADGVVRVLGRAGAPAAGLRTGVAPVAVAGDDRWVVVANAGSGTLTRIDARRRRVAGRPVRTGPSPVDVALAGGRAWVVDLQAGTLSAVDPASGAVRLRRRVCERPVSVAADTADVYVACAGDHRLVRVDPRTGDVRSRAQLGRDPAAVALGARAAWVALAGEDRLARYAR